jgi:hypothetical protein
LLVVLVVVLAVVGLYAVISAGLSRKDYGTFAFWSLPQRIDFCGRRFYEGSSLLGNARQFRYEDSANPATWTLISRTFTGRPIYAVVAHSPGYSVCTMVLYIPLGGQRWEDYPLSGGP